jgi:hypothetical protein
VGGEVVHDHHIARREAWGEHLLHISSEHLARHWFIEHERRGEAVAAQAGHEGGGLPMAVRGRIDQARASGAATIAARHVGGRPGLIEEDEAARVHITLPDPPAPPLFRDVGPVLLGGS